MTELHELTGITQNTLSLMANGKSNGIQFNTLEKIIKALDCSLDELFTVTGIPFEVYVELEEVKDNIYKFSLVGIDETNVESRITYGFEIFKNVTKTKRTLLQIVFLDRGKIELESLNNQLFIDRILDYSGESLSEELLLVYAYLIAYEILEDLNDPSINSTSLVTFSWYGLVKNNNEKIIKIKLVSKDIDNYSIEINNCLARPDFLAMNNNNILETNIIDKKVIIKMLLE